jgi:hypothetical protein
MNDLQLLAKKAWLVCVGLMLVAFVWNWYWLGVSDAGNQTRPEPLEMAPPIDTQQALSTILEHNLWEPTRKSQAATEASDQSGDSASEPQQISNWQLVAVAADGGELTALIGNPGDAASYKKYSQGDLLPSGEKIVKILGDRVVYQTNQISGERSDQDSAESSNESANESSVESKSNDSTTSTPLTKELYLFGRKGE